MRRIMDRYCFVYGYGMRVVLPVDDSVEAVFVISRVFYYTLGTVRFDKTIASVNYVTVSLFTLTLDITGVAIVYRVLVFVLRVGIVRFFLVGDVVCRCGVVDWRSVVDGCSVVYCGHVVISRRCVRHCVTVSAFVAVVLC